MILMTKTKSIGTCPACFQSVTLNSDGFVMRHGWKVSGNRQVGAYHQSWHSGPCFGTGYEPFEVSTKGTVEFFWDIIVPAGTACGRRIQHLQSHPAIIVGGKSTNHVREGHTMVYPEFEIRLVPGDVDVVVEKGYYAKKFSYETVLTARMDTETREYEAAVFAAHHLCDMVSSWVPKSVTAKPEKAKAIRPVHGQDGHRTVCGLRVYALRGGRMCAETTTTPESVTCEVCKTKMGV